MGAYILVGASAGGKVNGGIGMLIGLLNGGGKKVKVKLHTGNPGETGAANAATETTEKEVEITEYAELTPANWTNGRKSKAALEWPEVKATETYKWITLRDPADSAFVLGIELTAPVAVTIGDTFRINKEKLVIKVKPS